MRTFDLADFDEVPVVEAASSAILGDLSEVPHIEDIAAELRWTDDLNEYVTGDTPTDRSTALMEAAYMAAEEAWEDAHILSLVDFLADRWGKYDGRKDRDKVLLDILERVREKVGYDGIDTSVPGGFLEEHHATIVDETEILGFDDFVARSYPIEWILEGLLPFSGAGVLTGWPGAGKTSLSLQMAAHAAIGKKFLKWESTGPVKVLYLSLEMAATPLHKFVSGSREEYTTAEIKTLNKNLLLAPFGVPLHVDKEEGYDRLTSLIERHSPDVIMIDSLSMMTPKDLTDEEAMKTLFDGLAVVRQETGVAFLIIHHNRKKAADAQRNKKAELSDIYGSTYITAKVDFAINITKMEEKNVVQLDTLKNRLDPEPEPFELIRRGMVFTDPDALGGFLNASE